MIDSRLHVGTPRHDSLRGAPDGAAFQSFGRPLPIAARVAIIAGFIVVIFVLACIGAAARAGV